MDSDCKKFRRANSHPGEKSVLFDQTEARKINEQLEGPSEKQTEPR